MSYGIYKAGCKENMNQSLISILHVQEICLDKVLYRQANTNIVGINKCSSVGYLWE